MKIRNKPQNAGGGFGASLLLQAKPRSLERGEPTQKKRSLEPKTGKRSEVSLRLLDKIAGFAKGARGSLERVGKQGSDERLPYDTQKLSLGARNPNLTLKTVGEEERPAKLPSARRGRAGEPQASRASPPRFAELFNRKIVFAREAAPRGQQLDRSVNFLLKQPRKPCEPESALNTFYAKNALKFSSFTSGSRDQLRVPLAAKSTSPGAKRCTVETGRSVAAEGVKSKATSFRAPQGSSAGLQSLRAGELGVRRAADAPVPLFKQLEARKHARSIEKRETLQGGEQLNRHKDLQSEDKYPRSHMVQVNDFLPAPAAQSELEYAAEGKKNKYFDFLLHATKNMEGVPELARQLRTVFAVWRDDSLIEFFPFKTHQGLYRTLRRLGRGCFGEVLLAEQVLTAERVALKKIPKNSIKNKDARRKIDREVLILKRLNRVEGICKLFEVFEDEDFVYLVFELLPHGDLVKYFKDHALFEEDQLQGFFRKIVETVGQMHALGVLHRDIKLDNILLDETLGPKVCDFGISTLLEEEKKIFDTGGTPAYLSPEVILAEGNVCPKSDVWSLGVLLYLLSNGVVPFKAQNVQVLYQKIIVGRYTFPVDHSCSEELEDLVRCMLTVDLDQRYSVKQVLGHRWLSSSGVSKTTRQVLVDPMREALFHEAILLYLEHLGFPKSFLLQSLKKLAYNHVKACFDSLSVKLRKLPFTISHEYF